VSLLFPRCFDERALFRASQINGNFSMQCVIDV
jgi:hypothetical protein